MYLDGGEVGLYTLSHARGSTLSLTIQTGARMISQHMKRRYGQRIKEARRLITEAVRQSPKGATLEEICERAFPNVCSSSHKVSRDFKKRLYWHLSILVKKGLLDRSKSYTCCAVIRWKIKSKASSNPIGRPKTSSFIDTFDVIGQSLFPPPPDLTGETRVHLMEGGGYGLKGKGVRDQGSVIRDHSPVSLREVSAR